MKKGWKVIVYCQEEGSGKPWETMWEGVHRIHIPVKSQGSKGSVIFDGKSALHAARTPGLVLTLGYNTAFYSLLYRIFGVTNLMNMDGIEWKRGKWSRPVQAWFWLNEHMGCRLAHHLIADHPEMKKHLQRNVSPAKITVSAYGAERIDNADPRLITKYGLTPKSYATLIARPEPENSVLEAVQAFSARPRGIKLVVLGNYSESVPYQKAVLDAASDEVQFVGAIYEKELVAALRYHSLFYVHGHTVGGTNPSLLEALGAGNPVIAHNNRFNRWVASDGARYFDSVENCDELLTNLLENPQELEVMAYASRARHSEAFEWDTILAEQEAILLRALERGKKRGVTEGRPTKGRAVSVPAMSPASTRSTIADINAPRNM